MNEEAEQSTMEREEWECGLELSTINGGTTPPGPLREVTTLTHEASNDAMEDTVLVMKRFSQLI